MKEILNVADVDATLASSEGAPVFLFKHSTTCPISAAAHRQVAEYLKNAPEGSPDFRMVKVIESRPASNEIAARLGVIHQSPQLILVDKGKAVWNASHGAITVSAITEAASKLP